MMRFALNDRLVETGKPPGLPALDFLRHDEGLTGVKYACREGDCGSCAVLVGHRTDDAILYQVVTSCLVPLGALADRHVVTVEGLNRTRLTPIQQAFVDNGASQCGFCTPGFVVALTGHILEAKRWDANDAVEAVAGNICRCTGYASIIRSIDILLRALGGAVDPGEPRIPALVRERMLPDYFLRVDDLIPLSPPTPDAGPSPTQIVVSGGTDLYVQRPHRLEDGPIYIVPGTLAPAIRRDGEFVYLAATTTAEDMKRSDILAAAAGGIDRAMELMGSLPIRNRASIAGNLVNASPIGDMTIILLALDAEVGLAVGSNQRVVPLGDFFLGYKKLDLRPSELVEWVRFASGKSKRLFNFEKVSKRTHLDIATVNTAISLELDGGRLARVQLSAGGVAPVPMKLERTMAVLEGREPTLATALVAAETARSEVSPITDVRGSADYKRLLLGQLVLAHFQELFEVEAGQFSETPV
jgi:xanthine dehydrogenase small subunit